MEIKLRPYQQEAKDIIDNLPPGSYLAQMATGLGKCFAPGTEILMYDGSINVVEDIREGDAVMGPDSLPRYVSGLAHGQEMMYEIQPIKGDPYIVNESHILSLKITNTGRKRVSDGRGNMFCAGEICNISVGDYLKTSSTFKHVAKGWRASVDFAKKSVLLPPYILGVWLGDGATKNPYITTMEPEIVRELHRYASQNGMAVKVSSSENTGKAITYSIVGIKNGYGCNPFRNALSSYDLNSGKHIPHDYLYNDRECRLELLAGLMDSDGYLTDGSVFEIATVRREMAGGIQYLARSLGFAAYCSEKKVSGVVYYRINISGDTHLIPTRVERRKASERKQKKDVLMTGISVDPIGVGEYYGFELMGPDRLFLLGDFTVAHNTVTFASIDRPGRMLILSHREELVRQPLKYFDCTTGVEMAGESAPPSAEVVSASVQSLTRRLNRFDPDEFDIIVTDECFPAGTLVDGTPIEKIKIGDYINTYNHLTGFIEKKRVLHCFKNPVPEKLIVLNGNLICTENHPIYNLEKGEYQYAKDFISGDYMLHHVQEGTGAGLANEIAERLFSQKGARLLLDRLLPRIFSPHIFRNNGCDKPKICFREDEEEQPNEIGGDTLKSVGHATKYRSSSAGNQRERSRINHSSINADGRAQCILPDSGIFHRYKRIPEKLRLRGWLQSRHCNLRVEARYRGGWRKSSLLKEKRGGHEKNNLLGVSRVDSVEVLERRDTGRFEWLCSDGYVYNIEVEDNNNYFANGYLVHNCHHAAAQSYRRIYDYFTPRLHLGFTATPGRGDKVRLDDVFSDIIFTRDLRWGIENNYLSDIYCRRVNIGFDLRDVHTSRGDYAPGELEEAMEGTADAIAQAYRELATGATLIFAVSVNQAEEIAKRIPGAAVVTGETKERAAIIEAFTRGDIPCIVNVMVFTEGTDIPRVETIIIARPTQSDGLYTQMVGRGLRLYPGKKQLNLIDCVGVTGKASLCSAPSLLGIDMDAVPSSKTCEVEGMLFDLPMKAIAAADCPESWIKNISVVNLWAKEQKYNTHDINFFRMPDSSLVCSLPSKTIVIPAQDELGRTVYSGQIMATQQAIDAAYRELMEQHSDSAYIWDLNRTKCWGKQPASEKQLSIIRKRCKGFDSSNISKFEASQILNRLLNDYGR